MELVTVSEQSTGVISTGKSLTRRYESYGNEYLRLPMMLEWVQAVGIELEA